MFPGLDARPLGMGRSTCYRCYRPLPLCLCPAIPKVENRTLVTIVQHPRERFHAFNTVRFAALGLGRVEVVIDHGGRLRRDASPLGSLAGAALLYPTASARDITSLEPGERPERLIVIDGTWHHARTLYRDIPALAGLPHLTLPPHQRSEFAIRMQPEAHCLSSVEAITLALRALEPETAGIEDLLIAFRRMQSQQLERPRVGGRRREALRSPAARSVPRSLAEDYAKLVVAYAERSWSPGVGLISCAAERPATGERFYAVLQNPALADAELAYRGLTRAEVSAGRSFTDFCEEWTRFLGEESVLATWHQSGLDLLCDAAGRRRAGVALKATYRRLARFGGSLEHIISEEGIAPEPARAERGPRALERLENSLRLAEFLRARALESPA